LDERDGLKGVCKAFGGQLTDVSGMIDRAEEGKKEAEEEA